MAAEKSLRTLTPVRRHDKFPGFREDRLGRRDKSGIIINFQFFLRYFVNLLFDPDKPSYPSLMFASEAILSANTRQVGSIL